MIIQEIRYLGVKIIAGNKKLPAIYLINLGNMFKRDFI